MRDPKRLDKFYDKIKNDHKQYFPDLRFGQLMINFFQWYGTDPFYLEEDRFLRIWDEFVNQYK